MATAEALVNRALSYSNRVRSFGVDYFDLATGGRSTKYAAVDEWPKFWDQRTGFQVPLLSLRNQRFTSPLIVTVEPTESGQVIVSHNELRIWGEGPDRFSALSDFAETLSGLMHSYSEADPATLSDGARRYAEQLKALVRA